MKETGTEQHIYWKVETVEDEQRLCFHGWLGDHLDFTVEKWHVDNVTLQQIASKLQENQIGAGAWEDVWSVHRWTVYHNGKAICHLSYEEGQWDCDKKGNPTDKDIKRLEQNGCNHSKRFCPKEARVTCRGICPYGNEPTCDCYVCTGS